MNSVTPLQRSYPNINILWTEIIAEELARSGVRHAVISPGSRSTPMVFAVAQHPDITDHSVVDERSAAFYALGLAKATRQPVALLCTSGSAAANYYPAICEADRAQVPLLLLTADRPLHLRNSGAAQTMDQVKLYGDHVRLYLESAQPEADRQKLRSLRADICHAVAMARGPQAGPVHINLPFRKPLEPVEAEREGDTVHQDFVGEAHADVLGRPDGYAWTRYADAADGADRVADALLRAQRPLIIAGPDAEGGKYASQLIALASEYGLPVFAEAASQLRFAGEGPVIATSDLLLRSERLRAWLRPDCIVQFGDAPTNAQLLRFLDSTTAGEVICISSDRRRRDPAHRVSLHVYGDVSAIAARVDTVLSRGAMRVDRAWLSTLSMLDGKVRTHLADRLAKEEHAFEGGLVHALGDVMPEGSALVVSSSMPIRDLETFLPASSKSIEVFFNRGVNGIDGIVSTALGVARGRGSRCVLLTGDIAFLHNLTAVFGKGLRDVPLTIVLVNNNGGEIFDMLPVRDFDPVYTKHFRTPQDVDVAALVSALGLSYHEAKSVRGFSEVFGAAGLESGVQVIELRTDMEESGRIRRSVLKEIASAVDTMMETTSDTSPQTDAFPLHWRTLAEGDGAPVLLLHGFTRSTTSWEALTGMLSGCRVIAVDLMGHGASPVPGETAEYSLALAAERIEDLLDRLSLERVHLVGYSLGGRTALACAKRFPQRLASLALLSAHPGIEDKEELALRRRSDDELAARIEAQGLEAFVREWSGGAMFGAQQQTHPEAWYRAVGDRMQQRARGLAASLRGSGQGVQQPYWDILSKLHVPTLVAAGARDERYAGILQRMCDQIANAEALLMPDTGHDVLLERPGEIAGALRALWKRS